MQLIGRIIELLSSNLLLNSYRDSNLSPYFTALCEVGTHLSSYFTAFYEIGTHKTVK